MVSHFLNFSCLCVVFNFKVLEQVAGVFTYNHGSKLLPDYGYFHTLHMLYILPTKQRLDRPCLDGPLKIFFS